MNAEPNRQPLGIPVGGQFAPNAHAEPGVTLTRPEPVTYTAPLTGSVELSIASHDELPDWPENLPTPEVNFGFDNGKAETYVVVDGKMMTFWDSDHGIINDTDTGSNAWEDFDEEDQEAALEWGKAVHERVDNATYGVMMEGSHSPAVKDIILAQATGKPAPAGPDLADEKVRNAYVIEASARVSRARRELEQVYLIGVAQELREKHPEIDSFELTGDGDQPRMDVAWDAEGNQIAEDKLGQANHDVFRYRSHEDFESLMTLDTFYVSEAIAFRPGR